MLSVVHKRTDWRLGCCVAAAAFPDAIPRVFGLNTARSRTQDKMCLPDTNPL